MKAKATIRLKLPLTKEREAVKASLLPEVTKPGSSRAHVILTSENKYLVLTVDADDTIALRSTLNAYLRWISSTVKVVETLNCLT
jgi:tRNA threonylcarbamoyladenosine modification (KEOPS) complex  Pcc1 subunit